MSSAVMSHDLSIAPDASSERRALLLSILYSGLAVGALVGIGVSTYFWRQHVRALDLLKESPSQRAEELMASCESKLEEIERALAELQSARS